MKTLIDCSGVTIRFDARPADAILSALKANGFRWQNGHWFRRRVQGSADLICHLDRMLHPDRPDGACWNCGDANGFFRHRGAASPVLCANCYAASAPS